VAFAARWREGGIFGAQDCAKCRALKIIWSPILARLLERAKRVPAQEIG
jgi:hypothetical protein